MPVRSAILLLLVSLCSAAAQAGGPRVGFAVAVPLGPIAPVGVPVAVGPGAAVAFVPAGPVFVPPVVPVHPVVPVYAGPILGPVHVPGLYPLVAVPPAVVVTTSAPGSVHVAPTVGVFPAPVGVPQVPGVAPIVPLFFAPRTGGPIIVLPGGGF